VSQEEAELTQRDYDLLGLLAEGNRLGGRRTVPGSHLPLGCTEDQAERLVQAGYLYRVRGKQGIQYSATKKGEAAWRAYRSAGT
jgi:hypothetical protein